MGRKVVSKAAYEGGVIGMGKFLCKAEHQGKILRSTML